jgi:hypothetical protein
MPKTILEMVQAKVNSITNDPGEAEQNATLAIAAINGGIGSTAWRSYMMQFVEQNPPGQPVEPAQLARLLGTDNTLGDPGLDQRRAYLVSNAVCGSGTPDTTTFTVSSIDETLPNAGACVPPSVAGTFDTRYAKRTGRKRYRIEVVEA